MIENIRRFHPAKYFKLPVIKAVQRMYGNIDIEKAKEYQDIVEEYYPIETIVYGIKNIKQEFIENGRKEIYKRTYKD